MTLVSVEKRKLVKRGKEASLNVTTSTIKKEEAHVAQHEWACSTYTVYDPSKHNTCLSLGEPNDAWYFDSGASLSPLKKLILRWARLLTPKMLHTLFEALAKFIA